MAPGSVTASEGWKTMDEGDVLEQSRERSAIRELSTLGLELVHERVAQTFDRRQPARGPVDEQLGRKVDRIRRRSGSEDLGERDGLDGRKLGRAKTRRSVYEGGG